MINQILFNLMSDEHGITLLQSEMEDIKVAVRQDVWRKFPDEKPGPGQICIVAAGPSRVAQIIPLVWDRDEFTWHEQAEGLGLDPFPTEVATHWMPWPDDPGGGGIMAINKHTKTLIAAGIQDGLLRDHCVMELWTSVPADIDAAIERRERQIVALRDIKRAVEEEVVAIRLLSPAD